MEITQHFAVVHVDAPGQQEAAPPFPQGEWHVPTANEAILPLNTLSKSSDHKALHLEKQFLLICKNFEEFKMYVNSKY